MSLAPRFWETKTLAEMSDAEWESLCDGCAKCCLHKLEDADTGEIFFTRVRCRFLDEKTCRCSDYPNRTTIVPDCIELHRESIEEYSWLPHTCAYRLVARGQPLAAWHPLVSGDSDTVHRAGVSIRHRSISEEHVHPDGLEEHIVCWVE